MAKIDDLFRLMVAENASDLHLRAGSPPVLRIHGEMVPIKYRSLADDECRALVYEILTPAQREEFTKSWELDTSYYLAGTGRFRVNIFLQRVGLGAVFRVIPETVKTLDEMGLPSQLKTLIDAHKGLILVTGPTGSGKSTTLAAMIHEINMHQRSHIITIEDPIEFVHESIKAVVNQREVKSHTQSFANALRASLREDPDIILVGELRDLETISLAMTAAETGHLVFATLHTNGAAKTIDRIIDVFPHEQQAQIRTMLSESLRGVVAQGLLKRIDVPGRVPVFEILINTPACANLIREGKTFQLPSVMQTSSQHGMITFDASLAEHIRLGRLTKTSAETFLGRKLTMGSGDKATLDLGHVPQTASAGFQMTGILKKRA
ncbi:MAG: type IV pilus twitching motility protein PilT [Pseudomonadota bacterium]|nr:type IV pilus twitching motility protein PilT [Pseudomonadota bacterium]